MSENRMRWVIDKYKIGRIHIVGVVGKCGETEMKDKMVSICYYIAAIAKKLSGCTIQIYPRPNHEMDHNGIIVEIYFSFSKESDIDKFIINASIGLTKF